MIEFDEILTLDGECFYSDDYTLSKMTTEAYVRDPRFETILWSIKFGSAPSFWTLDDRFEHFVKNEVDWSRTAVIAHHAHFDGLWLNYRYGVRPAFWIDTLSMARVVHGAKAGNSLEALCQRHGIGAKGNYVTYAKGKHLADFSPAELREYGQYSCNDADRTHDLAQILLPQLPENELRLIDLTVRMFTEPVFIGDQEKLANAIVVEKQRRQEMLTIAGTLCPKCNGAGNLGVDLTSALRPCTYCDSTGLDKKRFTSKKKFAALLQTFGITPETKTSPTTGEQIFAFARTDPAMQELLEHEDDVVRHLAETRIACTSNIIESRATRFLHCARRGAMPVYLSHAGAHTLRPSGGDSMNFLNMSKHSANRPEMAVLKQSIKAPPGHVIVDVDSSQGEARLVGWSAGQWDLIEAFAQGRDVYSEEATKIYGRLVDRTKVKSDFIPGQVGKITILSFGFGSGWYTAALGFLKGVLGAPPIQFTEEHIAAMNINPDRFLGNPKKIQIVAEMPSRLELNDMLIHCIVAEHLVQSYRKRMGAICGKGGFWQTCETAINAMITGEEFVFGTNSVFRTGKDVIYTPGELWLDYRDIKRDENGDATYFNGRGRTKIYGSLLTENLIQHLHRTVVAEQMLEISEVLKVALWTYDAVAVVVPESEAEMAKQFMLQTMAKTPLWAPGLPLKSEGGYGHTLAEAA